MFSSRLLLKLHTINSEDVEDSSCISYWFQGTNAIVSDIDVQWQYKPMNFWNWYFMWILTNPAFCVCLYGFSKIYFMMFFMICLKDKYQDLQFVHKIIHRWNVPVWLNCHVSNTTAWSLALKSGISDHEKSSSICWV